MIYSWVGWVVVMLSGTVVFCLDRQGNVALTEHLSTTDQMQLLQLAQSRLEHFHKVEVWVGPLCIIRLRQSP